MAYSIGYASGPDGHPDYATLAEAAEVIRTNNGWAEVHLAEPVSETEHGFQVYYAYPTPEARAADKEWHKAAPCIWDL